MITTLDKALVALVMAAAFLINHFTNFHFALDESVATGIIAALTPVLVYIFPNKTAPA